LGLTDYARKGAIGSEGPHHHSTADHAHTTVHHRVALRFSHMWPTDGNGAPPCIMRASKFV